MAHKIRVQYTKRYYKTITRDIEVSGMLDETEIYDYLDKNFPKEELHNKSLVLEDEELEVIEEFV